MIFLISKDKMFMILEEKLIRWTKPSSETEQEKQERTERMIREAISSHNAFDNSSLTVFTKGSYANNTNVQLDSDVDIAVECTEVIYWEKSEDYNYKGGSPYTGIWTPQKLRDELILALKSKFPKQIDTSGSTAIQINSSSARVNADVVPCFSYKYYTKFSDVKGTKIFKTDGSKAVNYPMQQLENGIEKNNRTNRLYKRAVRILKRTANEMSKNGIFKEIPSYFVECLVYNCPDSLFESSTWIERIKNLLICIYNNTKNEEPKENRWLEVNASFYLFYPKQKWTRKDAEEFAIASWKYLGFK